MFIIQKLFLTVVVKKIFNSSLISSQNPSMNELNIFRKIKIIADWNHSLAFSQNNDILSK